MQYKGACMHVLARVRAYVYLCVSVIHPFHFGVDSCTEHTAVQDCNFC
jgi:hypothetical protein